MTVIRRKKAGGRKLVNATKITVDGINFASTLESKMYKLLKESGIEAKYEGQTYILFEAMVYPEENWERTRKTQTEMSDSRKLLPIRYTPDFVGDGFVIEVKGRPNESFPLRWKLFKKHLNTLEKQPLLFMPKSEADCKQVIEILKSKGYGLAKGK